MSQTYPEKKSFFRSLWNVVDGSRRFAMNVVFLIILAVILGAIFSPSGIKLQEKTALVLNISGNIVEQKSGSASDRLIAQAGGSDDEGQTQLRDIVAALEAAATDAKIDRVVLQLDGFSGSGLASLREVGLALDKFKASGKQVVAWGSSYDQSSYYLAARANEIYLHPMGTLVMTGYGRYRNYYKDALERVGVTVNVIRAGKFKNFGEPYFATGPSKETMESDKYLYDALWATYTTDVEAARKFEAGTINKTIEEITPRLKAAGGDFAKMVLDSKLVTALKTQNEFRAMMIERGANDEEKKTFRQISLSSYISLFKPNASGDAVGVIVAEGEIGDGVSPPGKIGGRSTAKLIRQARDDEKIKAIVLRVNSPGGSAFGSELIRHELELTRAAGKPVVVSMGNVAASGGYWVAMSSDELIADVATITGSIGVFGILPTAEKTMEKLSLYTGGYNTTWLGTAMYDPRRALDPRVAEIVQLGVQRIYTDFTTKAAAFRKTTPDKIDEVAQGRVWTGTQAKDRNLVDRTGTFADAVQSARTRAKLDDKTRVSYIEAERSKLQLFIEQFGGAAIKQVAAQFSQALNVPMLSSAAAIANVEGVNKLEHDLTWLAEMTANNKTGIPFAVVAHCLCDIK